MVPRLCSERKRNARRGDGPGTAVDTRVTLEGKGVPYTLDPWTGTITPIAQYTRGNDTVTVHVGLARDAATIIALSKDPESLGLFRPNAYVSSTTAQGAFQVGNSIVVRDTGGGTFTTVIGQNRDVTTTL